MFFHIWGQESPDQLGHQQEVDQDLLSVNIKICSKISNTFLFLFSNEILVIRAGIHKLLVRKANREDPDQTASTEVV